MPRRGHAARVPVAFGIVVVVVALQLLRQPGSRAWNTVWAEDGFVFAADSYTDPAWSTLFKGYAGYAHVVPRLVALPVRILPVSAVAAYLAVASTLLGALLALFVVRSMSGWIDSTALRVLLGLMTVLAPVSGFEVNANIANLSWPLLFAAFWAIVSQRRGAVDAALRALVVSLAALTTPVAILLVPWAILTMAVRRWRDDVIVVVSLLVSLGVQGLVIRAASPATAFTGSTVRELPEEYGVRVLGSAVFGERLLDPLWRNLGMALIVIALAIAVAFVLAARPQEQRREQRWLAAGALVASGVTFGWVVWERGTEVLRLLGGEWSSAGSRYAVVPVLLLVVGLAALADRASRPWLRTALVVQGLLVIALSFGQANPRADGPTWSSEVDRARQVCAAAGAPEDATVRISPPALEFAMSVPCDRLR